MRGRMDSVMEAYTTSPILTWVKSQSALFPILGFAGFKKLISFSMPN